MDEDLLRYDKEKEIVFIDCETFNLCLNEIHKLPWQVAMIRCKGDRAINSWDIHIKWDTDLKISKEAAQITRFNRKLHESKAIDKTQAFSIISEQLDNCDYIAGHNLLGFDIFLIKSLYRSMGRSYSHLVDKIIDTNYLARGIKYGIPYNRKEDSLTVYQYKILHKIQKGVRSNLKALGKEYNIEHDYDNLHDALVDLKLNLKVWNKLKWSVEV